MGQDKTEDKNETGVELTEGETELYDRQIRLWGLESQKRLRTAKILISGLNGLGAEVTKNIILSGVSSVKLHDVQLVTEEDYCSQFLAARQSLGKNRAEASLGRARALNPMVDISADTQPLKEKTAEFFSAFDVVVINGQSNDELLRIDAICQDLGVKFFASDVWGMFGFYFASLQQHSYVEDVVKFKEMEAKPNQKPKFEKVAVPFQREMNYPAYSAWIDFDINAAGYQRQLKKNGPGVVLLSVLQKFRTTYKRDPSYKTREADIVLLQAIRDELAPNSTLSNESLGVLFAQISPAVAVVGGVVAQEIIKVVTGMEAPHRNLFIFDPDTCAGYVQAIGVN
ncbi:GL27174 [Drosophila persimilis]|uniref:SUMO-activating enzyme subunit 1 n=1 Tax=Drosophila persimilis TaxID=7234 RepID=B4GZ66_DROPE|nr:SUMO-activating enzyme subunit 1 [Drosophila persimilis]EDW28084.1 GL27174 [Drosophila persimilis]